MPKSSGQPETDQLDQLLVKWADQLPEPPATKIEATLAQLRQVQIPAKKRGWLRLPVLGTMAAAVVVILVGGLAFLTLQAKSQPQTEVGGNTMPTITAGVTIPSVPPVAPPIAAEKLVEAPTATAAPTASATPDPTNTSRAVPAFVTMPAVSDVTQPAIIQPPLGSPTSEAPPDKVNRPIPRKPTDGSAPLPPPTIAAAPSATPLPPTAKPNVVVGPVTVSGQIVTVNASGLNLSTISERIVINSATRIIINGIVSNAAGLTPGQFAVVQAVPNDQGQLVAQSVTVSTKPPPGPPKPPTE